MQSGLNEPPAGGDAAGDLLRPERPLGPERDEGRRGVLPVPGLEGRLRCLQFRLVHDGW